MSKSFAKDSFAHKTNVMKLLNNFWRNGVSYTWNRLYVWRVIKVIFVLFDNISEILQSFGFS